MHERRVDREHPPRGFRCRDLTPPPAPPTVHACLEAQQYCRLAVFLWPSPCRCLSVETVRTRHQVGRSSITKGGFRPCSGIIGISGIREVDRIRPAGVRRLALGSETAYFCSPGTGSFKHEEDSMRPVRQGAASDRPPPPPTHRVQNERNQDMDKGKG